MTKIFTVLIIGFFYLGSYSKQNHDADNNSSNIISEIDNKIEVYGDLVFESFYSISELRPFSILQFEKTVDLHEKGWVEPKSYLNELSDKELNHLKTSIANYIFTLDDKDFILEKISYWCVTQMHFDFINTKIEISQDIILDANYSLDRTINAFEIISQQGPIELNELSDANKNEVYVGVLDRISSLKKKEQLEYYSELYSKLSKKY